MKIIISLAFVESGSVIDIWIWFFSSSSSNLYCSSSCAKAATVTIKKVESYGEGEKGEAEF